MRYLLILNCFLLASGCTVNKNIAYDSKPQTSQQHLENYISLIGYWYGEITTETGAKKRWLSAMSANGVYQIEFRLEKENGEVAISTQVGNWGYSGGIEFTITRATAHNGGELKEVDPRSPYNSNAYKLLHVDKEVHRYQGMETGTIFETKRVDENFKW